MKKKRTPAPIQGAPTKLSNSLADLLAMTQAGIDQSNLTSANPFYANTGWAPLTIQWTMLTYFYKSNGLVQALIDMPVQDAMRGGLEFTCDELDEDDIAEMEEDFESMNVYGNIIETEQWARLYGGAGLILDTGNGMGEPSKNEKPRYLNFIPVNRWELAGLRGSKTYGYYGKQISSQRVIEVTGKAAPALIRFQLQGWGMSEIERLLEPMNLYMKTENAIYEMLNEAKIDVYRIRDFNATLISNPGIVRDRIQMTNMLKGLNRALVLDKDDDFEQKTLTFSGLAEIKKENRIGIASAIRIPATKLFGISASGFNSGEDDIENYNAMVESTVRQHIRPMIRRILDAYALYKWGRPISIKFKFKPLRVMSSLDEQNIKTQKFQMINTLRVQGDLSKEEAADIMVREGIIPSKPKSMVDTLEDRDPKGTEPEENPKDPTPIEKAGGQVSDKDAD